MPRSHLGRLAALSVHVSGCCCAQVLIGDVEDAICLHAFYYAIWKRYGALPERYNWQLQAPDVPFYPLRPELVESTYLLYQVFDFSELQTMAWPKWFCSESHFSPPDLWPAAVWQPWSCLLACGGLWAGTVVLCNVVALLFASKKACFIRQAKTTLNNLF